MSARLAHSDLEMNSSTPSHLHAMRFTLKWTLTVFQSLKANVRLLDQLQNWSHLLIKMMICSHSGNKWILFVVSQAEKEATDPTHLLGGNMWYYIVMYGTIIILNLEVY